MDEVARIDPSAQRIFLINCLAALQMPLALHTVSHVRMLLLSAVSALIPALLALLLVG